LALRPDELAAITEGLAKERDGITHDLGRSGRRRFAPQVIDDPIDRDRLVPVEQQDGEQRELPAAAEPKGLIAPDDLERTEDTKVHSAPPSDDRTPWRIGWRVARFWTAGGEPVASWSPTTFVT